MSLRTQMIAQFPVRTEMASLEFVPEPEEAKMEEPDPTLCLITVRLVQWEYYNGATVLSIRDVKEQTIHITCGYMAEHVQNDARNENFAVAWKEALTEVLAKANLSPLMPCDLLPLGPLKKKTFGTKDEFKKALLVKGRLGKYL